MKVLVINWRDIENPEAGGAEIHIDEILKRKPADWQVDFVSAVFPGCAPEADIHGYHVTRIPNNSLFHITFRNYWNRILKKRNYDLVIDDVSKIPLATPDYIRNTPVLGILHHIHGKSLYQQISWPLALYVSAMERFFLRAYRHIPFLVVSESTRNELTRYYRFDQLIVSHNGIDFDELNRAYVAPAQRGKNMLYFGRMKKYKRVDHVIRAFRIVRETLPGTRLLLAGKGDDESRLREICRELALESAVDFLGFVDESAKPDMFRRASVYLIASEKEGWGISVIESNAAGLPAVGYNVEGLRDSIRDGQTGYLAENGNVEDLAEKVMRILKDPVKMETLSKNSVEWASGFSWNRTADEFYRIAGDAVRNFHRI